MDSERIPLNTFMSSSKVDIGEKLNIFILLVNNNALFSVDKLK